MPSLRSPLLIGREAETAVLRSALATARGGSGSAIALLGPAGIGKSRLVNEVVREVRAADLAERAGDNAAATELLLELARRDVARGALGTAEEILRRARASAPDELQAVVEDRLTDVLVHAGRLEDAAAVARSLLHRLHRQEAGDDQIAAVHLQLARAWTTAGRGEQAVEQIRRARSMTAAPSVAVAADLVEARCAFETGRFEAAEVLARRVATGSAPAAARCEALEVLGLAARRTDLARAEDCFTKALEIAERHDLPLPRARALQELATVDLFTGLDTRRARQARDDAVRVGAVSLAVLADYHLGSIHVWRGEADDALPLLESCEERCRTLRLPLLPMVLVMRSELLAQLGCTDGVAALCAEAADRAPGGNHLQGAVRGVEATARLLAEDRDGALAILDDATARMRAGGLATTSPPPLAWWALVATAAGRDVRTELDALPGAKLARWTTGLLGHVRAIHEGRAGRAAEAAAAAAKADRVLATPVEMPHFRHLARRVVAEAAVKDGWGDPVPWLIEDAAYFSTLGHHAVARACGALLRSAGARVPRRTPGPPVVPDLAARGVTAREMEVLALIAEGLSNAEIASRLVLSRRTVEKHVQRLLGKTLLGTRAELVSAAVRGNWTR